MSLKINKSTLLLLLLCLFIGMSVVATNIGSSLRYIKYTIPIFFSLFLLINYKKIKVYRVPIKNLQLFLVLIIINFIYSLFTFNLSIRFIEESVLILIPILAVIVSTSIIKTPIHNILDYLFVVYGIVFFVGNSQFFFNPNIVNEFIDALRTSTMPTESWMAFPFGLFSLHYILQRRKLRAFIALLFFVLAFKRISILAACLALLIFWFFYKYRKKTFNPNRAFVWFIVLNSALLIIIYNFIQGNFDAAIKDITGLSPNHFTQGRLRIYTDSVNHFDDNLLFGNSLGSTNLFLKENFPNIHFLHSDILKIILELGIVSYLIWLITFFKINLVSAKAVPILIFMNILFLSDNVFIYFDTLFIFYLMIVLYHNNNLDERRESI
ncbi:O-antigen ligase family protein [Flavivirga amylovorans]|uniref:O-antigen ligase family protein n=1 Tax=Flavivirga amylovorans TaxID=870486 RepID=A0ABT8X6U0_9FLAO|nr:O-antigen ligase family protein [Flavivirga amylovorans]MDO5989275.1 O-antigen ligase family protein [Flavivirga amylovorans]